jgi:hypothetical protein
VAADLEKPIQTMIDATNRGDSEALLGAFSDDAVLTDWGRTFAGKSEIARWNADENIGTHNHIRVMGVKRVGSAVDVNVVVTGEGYNGPGSLIFEVEGESIKRLTITD